MTIYGPILKVYDAKEEMGCTILSNIQLFFNDLFLLLFYLLVKLMILSHISILSCRNIQIRVFHANIFKSACFMQKYWSGTVTRYPVMRG